MHVTVSVEGGVGQDCHSLTSCFSCLFWSMTLLGLWPYVMKRLITLWSNSTFSSFHMAVSNGRVTGTVTVCALDGVSHYSIFSFSLVRDWENRVITWLVNMWCCMIGEPVPLGLCCDALPQPSELFRSSTGVGSLEVKTLVLSDVIRTIVDVSGQMLGRSDIHVVLNHLQKRLEGL